ncbi:MAG TPA: YceI family protein [Paracoccaceae bacterium]|nr:YceI family protein [Paracoccaceae bacterium]
MGYLRLVAALVTLALASAPAAAAPYLIDHDHSAITFSASHLGFSRFHGRFTSWRGEIDFDPEAIENSSVRFEIDAESFETGSKTRDDNTKYFPDMLNVKVFPKITFVSTRIELTSAETVRMTGDLTIRDVTRPVTFDVRLNARGVTPISRGKEVFGFTAAGEIDRAAFGIGFAAPAVSGIVPVRIDLEIMPAN